ncbi:MAG: hypothetical protein ABJM36_00040 [Algibacter sp.]|uniref:hypothetical protein n=1 Tax=Algibacter sp. TaxID=1872428 RepID=UPI00329A42F9
MSRKEGILSNIVGFLFYGIFIYGEIFGIYHTFKSHSKLDGLISIVIPPYAWYYSAEMWWHDDFEEVDWEKKLKSDMEISIYLLSQAHNDQIDRFELNDKLEKFSSKINKYPEEKLDFLKNGSRIYIKYSISLENEVIEGMTNFYENGKYDFKKSRETKILEQKLRSYNIDSKIEIIKEQNEQSHKQLSTSLTNSGGSFDESQVLEFKENISSLKKRQNIEFKKIFKFIFNEEL